MGQIAQLVAKIEFPDSFRGYEHDAVDNFLSKIAQLDVDVPTAIEPAVVPTIEPLVLREVVDHAQQTSSTPEPATTETMVRMLSAAQRTVDDTLSEARANAAPMTSDAKARADVLDRDSREAAERIVSDARYEARQAGEKARVEQQTAVDQLTSQRNSISNELEQLTAHVAAERAKLVDTLSRLAVVVQDPRALSVAPLSVSAEVTAQRLPASDAEPEQPAV